MSEKANETWRDAYDPRGHPVDCPYHVDQYPHECLCGAIKPRSMTAHLTDLERLSGGER